MFFLTFLDLVQNDYKGIFAYFLSSYFLNKQMYLLKQECLKKKIFHFDLL